MNASRELIATVTRQVTGLNAYRIPDREDVFASYQGLVEKYSVLVRDDLADELESRINSIFNMESESTLHALVMLLHLAQSSGLEKPMPEELIPKQPETENKLDWADIIRDEPLEGDHWKNWQPTPEDESSTDDDSQQEQEKDANDKKEENYDDSEVREKVR
ncbi:hypothetical protein V1512DRAFT_244653 [Lipomyces arxii]|uniref:uncharacterized protein n=1 Tax=Lipomyces arxii TaxID=56418 RepID=UPI0034CF3D7A